MLRDRSRELHQGSYRRIRAVPDSLEGWFDRRQKTPDIRHHGPECQILVVRISESID